MVAYPNNPRLTIRESVFEVNLSYVASSRTAYVT